ncbi:unnamed protein product, partial [Brenthis ino]
MEMQEIEPIPYDQFQRWLPDLPPNYMMQMLGDSINDDSLYPRKSADDLVAPPLRQVDNRPRKGRVVPEIYDTNIEQLNTKDIKKSFALTPLDSGYFEEIAISPKTIPTDTPQVAPLGPQRQRVPMPPQSEFLSAYALPRYLMPHDIGYDDSPRIPRPPNNLLDQEINMINQMEMQEIEPIPYDQFQRWLPDLPPNYMMQMLGDSINDDSLYPRKSADDLVAPPLRQVDNRPRKGRVVPEIYDTNIEQLNTKDIKKSFALTPLDSGYFEEIAISPKTTTPEVDERRQEYEVLEPRPARQNPNWSKTKTLVAEDMDILRAGFTRDDAEGTDKPHLYHVLETPTADPAESIYGVAIIAAVGAALTMAIIGFAFGWYTLSRKAKAAADVDYPAYGVTGPTVDLSGDRKLAQSAHMYHYQHQKQQIIAMERNGLDHRNGSVSDPESDEENEEGDYTVYECPGFATTGDMEVKNPLFKGDTTPAAPKSDAAKSQPRE